MSLLLLLLLLLLMYCSNYSECGGPELIGRDGFRGFAAWANETESKCIKTPCCRGPNPIPISLANTTGAPVL